VAMKTHHSAPVSESSEGSKNENSRALFALVLVNFVGYFYASFISPLLPLFLEKFSLTLAQVGLLTAMYRLVGIFVEPSAGYIADHYRTRLFVLGGPLLAIVFMPLVGIAPSFSILLLFVCLGAMGPHMLYPTSVGMVSSYSGRHLGFSMSLLEVGGIVGFGMGPLFITYCVGSYGLESSPFTMVLGLALMFFLFRVVPLPREEGLKGFGFVRSVKEILGGAWQSILVIWVVMVLRSVVCQSVFTFVPVLYAREGRSLISIGLIVSLFVLSGAISNPLAGALSDRISRKSIMYFLLPGATAGLYLLLFLSGAWVYVGALMAGFFLWPMVPLGLVMAQQWAPKGRSVVASLMIGLATGIAATVMPALGKAADLFSIRPVLFFVWLVPLLMIGLIHFVPEKR
jgi:FSR family fosmidomycin resistance protein-like MFS transporter